MTYTNQDGDKIIVDGYDKTHGKATVRFHIEKPSKQGNGTATSGTITKYTVDQFNEYLQKNGYQNG